MDESFFPSRRFRNIFVGVAVFVVLIGAVLMYQQSNTAPEPVATPTQTVTVSGGARTQPFEVYAREKGMEANPKEQALKLKETEHFEQAPYPQAPLMVDGVMFSETEVGVEGWTATEVAFIKALNETGVQGAESLFAYPQAYEVSAQATIPLPVTAQRLDTVALTPYSVLVAYPAGEDKVLYVRYIFSPESDEDVSTWKVELVEVL